MLSCSFPTLLSLGFTATVNADLKLATLQETVTVSGASPVIDTSATRVQQNFKLAQLESIPNGRDMWTGRVTGRVTFVDNLLTPG